MNKIIIFLLMIFLHIVDDYYLQGWLASAKQKQWWKDNAPQELYKYDYIMALFMHAFSWTFMVMLVPSIVCSTWYPILFIGHMCLHAFIDNEKANRKTINLVTDQFSHLVQIISIWCTYFIF